MATEQRRVVVEGAVAEIPDYVKIKVRHGGNEGIRYVHGKDGAQLQLRPRESGEIEVPEKEAERLRKASQDETGNYLVVEGAEPKKAKAERGEQDKELTRAELEELERKNLEAASKSAAPQRSDAGPGAQTGGSEKLARGDLEAMTKEELLEYAKKHNIDTVKASDNKGEMVNDIMKAQRS